MERVENDFYIATVLLLPQLIFVNNIKRIFIRRSSFHRVSIKRFIPTIRQLVRAELIFEASLISNLL